MRVWFVSQFVSEHIWYNDTDPGDSCGEDTCDIEYCTHCYQYETTYDSEFGASVLFATEAQAVTERNRLFMENYEKERRSHVDRLARYNKRREALELLAQFGLDPEDLYPYGIGDEPKFSHPRCPRIGYLEVVEN